MTTLQRLPIKKYFLMLCSLLCSMLLFAVPPVITSFSPASGPVGTLIKITGTNLGNPTAFSIGGVNAIVVSNTGTQLTGLLMPGTTTGTVNITTADGTAVSGTTFTVVANVPPNQQQGPKLLATGAVGPSYYGAVSVSADGNTAIVGGYGDNNFFGAAWVYTRTGGVWTQQGPKLIGTGAVGNALQGSSVSLSADGNTAIVGGYSDNGGVGAAWVFIRSNGVWSQQGSKLVGSDAIGLSNQGISVCLSADGNNAIVGGNKDSGEEGAAWVYTRSGSVWTQQGPKLAGISFSNSLQGSSVSLSADGNTALVGGPKEGSGNTGAAWVYTRIGGIWIQQGDLIGTGAVGPAYQGISVSLSADGNTAIVGGVTDNNGIGASWVFTRSGGVWTQQGPKLVGTGAQLQSSQGSSISLSADGNTAIVGGKGDNNDNGAVWVFKRTGAVWTQQGSKLVGTGGVGQSQQGISVSLSADGNTSIVGGIKDNNFLGAAWVFIGSTTPVPPPVITSFSPASGPIGTLIKITGTNLDIPTAFSIGDINAIVVSSNGTQLTGLVMPGTTAGTVSISTPSGTAVSGTSFTVVPNTPPTQQQGLKLVGTGSVGGATQGFKVALSADGNTAIVGGDEDNNNVGAAWIYTRSAGAWTQQGTKLVGSGSVGFASQGASVSLSADGNTAIVGGSGDNNNIGAVWVFTRSGNVWTQQGSKLVGTGVVGQSFQGFSVSLSADGNTAIVGGNGDNSNTGAVWVYTRSNGVWTQQGPKLVGTGAVGGAFQGSAVSLSADGNNAIIGGPEDNNNIGAAWVFTRFDVVWTQQGTKLIGSGAVGPAYQGCSVSLSANGKTAIVGGSNDNGNIGAAWVFNRTGVIWTQQGSKLIGAGAVGPASQGFSVSLSADGSTTLIGGYDDNTGIGASWVFTRSGGVWTQQGVKLVGTGALGAGQQGVAVSLSADGNTAMVGGDFDNNRQGAVWVYFGSTTPVAPPVITSFSPSSGPVGSLITITGTNLGNPSAFSIGGVSAIVVSNNGTQLTGLVMPGSTTGTINITTAIGTAVSANSFTVVPNTAPSQQQGPKLVAGGLPIGTISYQGSSVSVSADGNTAIVGGRGREIGNNYEVCSAWVYTRSGGVWTQQGPKLVGTGAVGASNLGSSVSISADGNTAIVGGKFDNSANGAAWIFTRSGGIWTQQGPKLIGTGAVGAAGDIFQGVSVSLSADGNTAIVGGNGDNNSIGAAWIYVRSNGVWEQQGNKLVGFGAIGSSSQGRSVSISADGNTALVGGPRDDGSRGAVWIFTRTGNIWTQQGPKLIGNDAVVTAGAYQGSSVSLSADGNTAIMGGYGDNFGIGAAWVFIRSGGLWTQQGPKLVGIGAVGQSGQGLSVSLSADGNTALVGGPVDTSNAGAAWVYKRSGGNWVQSGGKLVGTGAIGIVGGDQRISVSLSADGNTAIIGGEADNNGTGAAWVFTGSTTPVAPPLITSFSPSSGPIGTLITITGTSLENPTNFNIGGFNAIVISNNGTQLTGLVMPGTTSGTVNITTANGTAVSSTTFTVVPNTPPNQQQGPKLVGTGAVGQSTLGIAMSVSADGNTAIVGGAGDNNNLGAAWIYTRSNGVWTQQGSKLVGTGAVGQSRQGKSVSLSADGNTALIGGSADNGNIGAVWVFTRSAGIWTQQGNKLVGIGQVGQSQQGFSVSLSADGNTALIGGQADNNFIGASWVFTRSGAVWTQQGNKLVGSGVVGNPGQGLSVSLSANGNTAIVGGLQDNNLIGAAWVYTRSGGVWTQQGPKLVGTGAVGQSSQGSSVSLSADGNTAILGGYGDNNFIGAAWVFTRSGAVWSQQGNKLVGTGVVGQSNQGVSISLSADGNTAIVGGDGDNNLLGAAWVYKRSGSVWTHQGSKLVGTNAFGQSKQGSSVSLSADGNTAMVGGAGENNSQGAAWVYTGSTTPVAPPVITSFSPTSGPIGTLINITGTNLGNPTAFTIGGVSAIVVSNTGTQLTGLVMPGTTTGTVNIITANGTAVSGTSFTVVPNTPPTLQQGPKLVGTGVVGGPPSQGNSVAVSADGKTAIMGGPLDDFGVGAVWVYTLTGGVWTQQGNKLVGLGAVGQTYQGSSVALAADGNTAIIGGLGDNNFLGAAWVFTRSGGLWTQQGPKLVGTGALGAANQGSSVSLSADGNTALVGGNEDNNSIGASWVYIRSGGVWAQQGPKLVGTGAVGTAFQGCSVSLSADGNTAIVGGFGDNNFQGAVWVFTRSGGVWTQQGSKLVGTGAVGAALQGNSVSLSADGNTAIVGGPFDDNLNGTAWVFTRSGGVWTQQGPKIVGTGVVGNSARQGVSVSLSADGNTAIVGGPYDNSETGAAWVYTRSGGVWTQQGPKIVGTGVVGNTAFQGVSVSLSADGNTAIVGGPYDNSETGAAWVYNGQSQACAVPGIVSGTSPLCIGVNSSFASSGTTGGLWSSSNPAVASINATTGAVTTLTAGTTNITYTVTLAGGCPGSASSSQQLTVNPTVNAGTVTGSSPLCINATATYNSSGNAGGVWSSSNNAIATVNAANGLVTAVSAGTATITYTLNSGCGAPVSSAASVTVNQTVNAGTVTGSSPLCINATATYSSSGNAGGVWSSSNNAVATVNAASGLVTALSAGTATITYTLNSGCGAPLSSAASVTVNPTVNAGTVTGSSPLCINATATYSSSGNAGGVWSSSNNAVATVNAASGLVTAISAGTATITYTLNSGCGAPVSSAASVTVNPTVNAGTVTGSSPLCINATATYSSSGNAGGVWSSSNNAVATVNAASGLVTAISAGTATITYTLNSGCGAPVSSAASVTVNPNVNAGVVTGIATLQVTATATYSSNGTAGGTWSSTAPTIASVNAITGLVTALAAGTTNITYTVSGCGGPQSAFQTLTVNTNIGNPGTVSGTTPLCIGSTATYTSNGTSGGTWSSSNPGVATVNPSSGLVTPLSAGTTNITYTVTGPASSFQTLNVTANVNAGTVTGSSPLCINATATYSSSGNAGGVWSSSNNAVATVNAASGLVTAVAAGTATITYTLNSGCGSPVSSGASVTVNPNVSAGVVTGIATLQVAATATYSSNGTAGGTWSSTAPTIASVNAITGLVTALAAGTTNITYTVSGCGGPQSAFQSLTVNTNVGNPGTVSGTTPLCIGATATYTSN
jgi:uncharacterized protein YjdB